MFSFFFLKFVITKKNQKTKTDDESSPKNNRLFNSEMEKIILFTFILALIVISTIITIVIILPSSHKAEHPSYEYIHGQLKDLSICLTLFNITDRNGACLVHTDKNFYDASDMCVMHNMTLLEVSSSDEHERIFEETKSIFGSGGGTRIWINGKWSSTSDAWLAFPKNETFYLNIEHVEQRYGRKPSDGECLAIESNRVDKYHISSVPCSGKHYFYCEF